MFEGGGRFEQRRNTELEGDQIETITNELLDDRELIEYLQEKLRQKVDFKQTVVDDDGTNHYSEWKRLGIFIVHWKRLPDPLVGILQKNGVDIYADDVLELHIPPQSVTLEDLMHSFKRLQEYLNFNRSDRYLPRYIYGVSYLAHYAKRWGFIVVDLPEVIQGESGAAAILRKYAEKVEDPKKQRIAHKFQVSDIKLCYISVRNFLSR